MRPTTLLTLSLLLLLSSFPLVALGTGDGPVALWWVGLAAIAVGGALPPLSRFVVDDD